MPTPTWQPAVSCVKANRRVSLPSQNHSYVLPPALVNQAQDRSYVPPPVFVQMQVVRSYEPPVQVRSYVPPPACMPMQVVRSYEPPVQVTLSWVPVPVSLSYVPPPPPLMQHRDVREEDSLASELKVPEEVLSSFLELPKFARGLLVCAAVARMANPSHQWVPGDRKEASFCHQSSSPAKSSHRSAASPFREAQDVREEAALLPEEAATRIQQAFRALRSRGADLRLMSQVERVCRNDPHLEELCLRGARMPLPEQGSRTSARLLIALQSNTMLRKLDISRSNLRGSASALLLAEALERNSTLRVLDISGNYLVAEDLEIIFEALRRNSGLEELYCGEQYGVVDGKLSYKAFKLVDESLKLNRTLVKVAMGELDKYFQHSISNSLMRNAEARRKARHEQLLSLSGA